MERAESAIRHSEVDHSRSTLNPPL